MRTVYERRPDIEKLPGRRRESFPDIVDEPFWELFEQAKPYSMLHITGFYNLYSSVRYVAAAGIPGDLVECGVWLGGASLLMAKAAALFGLDDRRVWLFDTFAGFPPGSTDVKLGQSVKGPSYRNFREGVEANLREAGVAEDVYVMVEGDVVETLPRHAPDAIALLRLDTDFYESTKAELEHLYPRLSPGGVLIIDDYGLYDGSRRATDDCLQGEAILLHRVDAGIRCGLKPLR